MTHYIIKALNGKLCVLWLSYIKPTGYFSCFVSLTNTSAVLPILPFGYPRKVVSCKELIKWALFSWRRRSCPAHGGGGGGGDDGCGPSSVMSVSDECLSALGKLASVYFSMKWSKYEIANGYDHFFANVLRQLKPSYDLYQECNSPWKKCK